MKVEGLTEEITIMCEVCGEDYSTEEIKWDYLNKCFACSDCNCCEDENFLHLISTT